jgi:hypothetical protein
MARLNKLPIEKWKLEYLIVTPLRCPPRGKGEIA